MAEAQIHPPTHHPMHPSETDFRTGFKRSLIFHGALVVFVLLKTLVFPGNPKPYISTLRVDLVGLPDLLKKDMHNVQALPPSAELPQPTTKHVPKAVEPAEPDEMVLRPKKTERTSKDREKKLKSALDRIKSLAKIASLEKKASPVIKGNQVSKGTSLSGDARESAEASYYDSLKAKLQDNWALPIWLARQNLAAQVQIFVDSRGRILSYRFLKPSGNAQFDDAVKKTLAESQPFMTPPSEMAQTLMTDGVLIGFPL